ncbi:MAG: Flp pilus assembly protein CpaB [Chloroflexi bacterium]|nr:Flp pilus assembly protein CpaB [Chloroflexota bacterium]MBU1751942.1 Flp pilus assembly protein CpaB [Chloroflexota bacterium]
MKRGRILIILGILLGVITFAGVFFVLSQPKGEEQKVETVDLVVALQEIPERSQIQGTWVGLRGFALGSDPPGAMRRMDDVIGKTTINRVYEGMPILDVNLAITATLYGVPYLLPDGMVGVAFPIADISGVAGAIRAGDTVDLLISMDVSPQEGETGGRRTTQLTLQDLTVLHVGQWVAAGGEVEQGGAAVLIFQVTRQDALILKWVRENGTVDLALRPATDHNIIDLGTIEAVHVDFIIEAYDLPRPPVVAE